MSHCPTKRGIARNIAKKRGWSGRLHDWKQVVWGVTKSPMKALRLGPGGKVRVVLAKGPTISLQVDHAKE
jgi:hypothetical protein